MILGKVFNSLCYNLYALVQIFIAENGQILKTQSVHLVTLLSTLKFNWKTNFLPQKKSLFGRPKNLSNFLSIKYLYFSRTLAQNIYSSLEKIKALFSQNISKTFSQITFRINRGAAVAQWIRLRLPSCRPGFDSQAHHLCFFQFQFEFKL